MLWASLFTAPLGLTQPFFVPAYWNPPSLFDLAQTTGFDIESLIFSFGIGGNGIVIHNFLTGYGGLTPSEQAASRHRRHSWPLAVPFASFPLLNLLHWNPIYSAIAAMVLGVLAMLFCRPTLAPKLGVGAILFLGYYAAFLLGLEWTAPGYVERTWNLPALSGLAIAGLPMEELLFAAAFSACLSCIYEHLVGRRPYKLYAPLPSSEKARWPENFAKFSLPTPANLLLGRAPSRMRSSRSALKSTPALTPENAKRWAPRWAASRFIIGDSVASLVEAGEMSVSTVKDLVPGSGLRFADRGIKP
jgi:hypothetical protein